MLEKAIERVDETRDLIIIEYTKDGYVEVYNTVMARSHAVWMRSRFNKQFDP